MILWTIQPEEAYEELNKTGVLRCNKNKIEDLDFWGPKYKWMAEQMKKRIRSTPVGVEYPVWFWYKRKGERKKPDLRSKREFCEKGKTMYLIEANIPDEDVLLSDFMAWHFVLNETHTYHSAKTEEEFDRLDEWLNSLSQDEREKEIEKSWETIFDIEPYKNDFCENGYWVQATVWELKKENVVKVRKFSC